MLIGLADHAVYGLLAAAAWCMVRESLPLLPGPKGGPESHDGY